MPHNSQGSIISDHNGQYATGAWFPQYQGMHGAIFIACAPLKTYNLKKLSVIVLDPDYAQIAVKYFFSYSSILYKHEKNNFKRRSNLFTEKKKLNYYSHKRACKVNGRHVNLSLIHI